jgi:hypothetical protein
MVNAQVLRGGSDSPTSVPPLVSSAPPPTVESTTTTVASTQLVYRVGDCGVVTVDAAGGVLSLVSVVPSPGWEVQVSELSAVSMLEVRFAALGLEVTMTAVVVDGAVVPSVSSGVIEVVGDDDRGGAGAVVATPSVAPAPTPPAAPVTPPTAEAHVDDSREDEPHDEEHEVEDEVEHEDGHDDDD